MRHDRLGHDAPRGEVQRDFAPPRGPVVGAQPESPLQPQDKRKPSRDQQQVIEITLEKRSAGVVAKPEPVQQIEDAGGNAERVEQIAESLHNNAAISSPEPSASNSRSTNGGRNENGEGMRDYGGTSACAQIADAPARRGKSAVGQSLLTARCHLTVLGCLMKTPRLHFSAHQVFRRPRQRPRLAAGVAGRWERFVPVCFPNFGMAARWLRRIGTCLLAKSELAANAR